MHLLHFTLLITDNVLFLLAGSFLDFTSKLFFAYCRLAHPQRDVVGGVLVVGCTYWLISFRVFFHYINFVPSPSTPRREKALQNLNIDSKAV